MRSRTTSIVIGLVVILSPGCGSDGDERAVPRPPRDAYVEKGDAICRDIRDRGEAIRDRVGGRDDASVQAQGLREIAALYREAVKRFGALEDGAAAEAMEGYLVTVRENARLLERAARALDKGDVDSGKALVERTRQAAESAQAVPRRFGFEVCGSG